MLFTDIAQNKKTHGAIAFDDLRIVKLGSSALVSEKFELNKNVFASIAAQVAELAARGVPSVLVSSGAVAAGQAKLASAHHSKFARAAAGQASIITAWHSAFAQHGTSIAQVLVTGVELRAHADHVASVLFAHLGAGIVPVVNADDIFNPLCGEAAAAENNDLLAAHLAQLLSARRLYLLSDVPGVFADGKVLRSIGANESLEFLKEGARSTIGTGGMKIKVTAAQQAAQNGCETIIGAAAHPDILLDTGLGTIVAPFSAEVFSGTLREFT